MSNVPLVQFHGRIPKWSTQLVEQFAATIADNCYLVSGRLEALNRPFPVAEFPTFVGTVRRIFPVDTQVGELMLPFEDADTYLVKAPLTNDAYLRYYWTTGSGPLQYRAGSEVTNWTNGVIGSDLGVRAPTVQADLNPVGGSEVEETRAYFYTFVTDYGEEGPPSPVTLATAPIDAAWNYGTITGMEVPLEPQYTKRRIYRTVTGTGGSTEYHFIQEQLIADDDFVDTTDSDEVALNDIFEGFLWHPPEEDLQGLLAHPNGFLIAFKGRDILFSEPYRPHAWPSEYVYSTKNTIVGLGLFGNTLVACTDKNVVILTGSHPSTITIIEGSRNEPCQSHHGIVSTDRGVIFPGVSGLMIVTAAGLDNMTEQIMDPRQWVEEYTPSTIHAGWFNDSYIAFTSTTGGFMFTPRSEIGFFVDLNNFENVLDVGDTTFGDRLFIVRDNAAWSWNPPGGFPLGYKWKSKEFVLPNPTNMGAFRMDFTDYMDQATDWLTQIGAFNVARFNAGPLNPINFSVINGVHIMDAVDTTVLQAKTPLGGSQLFRLEDENEKTGWVILRVYADDVLVYENYITRREPLRLPSGFKADHWHFELEGNKSVKYLKVAQTGRELKTI